MPRCTIPLTLTAGSIVQVRGGPYTLASVTWTLNGTEVNPVYLRGPTGEKIVFGSGASIFITAVGTYAIVENVDLPQFTFSGSTSHHLSLRNSRIHDHPGTGEMVELKAGVQNIVIYNNEIDHNGVIPSGADHHGVVIGGVNISDVWIVDNNIHHNSGDSIQFCHD